MRATPALDYLDWPEEDHDGVFVSWFPLDPRELHLPRLRFGPAVMRAQRAALVTGDHPLAARTGILLAATGAPDDQVPRPTQLTGTIQLT
jgi:hypothetical protein